MAENKQKPTPGLKHTQRVAFRRMRKEDVENIQKSLGRLEKALDLYISKSNIDKGDIMNKIDEKKGGPGSGQRGHKTPENQTTSMTRSRMEYSTYPATREREKEEARRERMAANRMKGSFKNG